LWPDSLRSALEGCRCCIAAQIASSDVTIESV